ncbi:MAG: hypothetical protein GEV10_21680 [Streptosporangiales bacterium]|nr:hypothetical protein [Streptosporangiales bacterium]
MREVDGADGELVEEAEVGFLVDFVLDVGELTFQVGALGVEFGSAGVDVADEVGVDVLGEFEGMDQPFALGMSRRDGLA